MMLGLSSLAGTTGINISEGEFTGGDKIKVFPILMCSLSSLTIPVGERDRRGVGCGLSIDQTRLFV